MVQRRYKNFEFLLLKRLVACPRDWQKHGLVGTFNPSVIGALGRDQAHQHPISQKTCPMNLCAPFQRHFYLWLLRAAAQTDANLVISRPSDDKK